FSMANSADRKRPSWDRNSSWPLGWSVRTPTRPLTRPGSDARSKRSSRASRCDSRDLVRLRHLQSARVRNVQYPRKAHADVGLGKAHIRFPNEIMDDLRAIRVAGDIHDPELQRARRPLRQVGRPRGAYQAGHIVIEWKYAIADDRVNDPVAMTQHTP